MTQLVLGLGNPGLRYLNTRHNIGFLVADALARRAFVGLDKSQGGALVAKARLADTPVVIGKPQDFMNRSGGSAQALSAFYKVAPPEVIVVHDDLDLSFGDVRLKSGGGHGGHNGLRDIIAKLGSADFVRVRVGIGRPPPQWNTADYVLGGWSAEELTSLDVVVLEAVDAVEAVLREGVQRAMNSVNARNRGGPPAR